MSITASNYVVNTTSPSIPRITVNMQTATVAAVESAASAYIVSANEYAGKYVDTVSVRDYAYDRLMKDVAADTENMTSGGIDLVSNSVELHVKADDLFNEAAGGTSLNSVNAVTNVATRFTSLYSAYYTESGVCVLDTNASCYAEAVEYDTQAVTVSADVADAVSSGSIFIKDVPNAIGAACTYTNYAENNGDYEPQFTISHVDQISDDVQSAGWVIAEAGQSDAIAYSVSDRLDGNETWVDVEAGNEEPVNEG